MDTEEKSETETIFEDCDDDGKEFDVISDQTAGGRTTVEVRLDTIERRPRRRCTRVLMSLVNISIPSDLTRSLTAKPS